MDAAFRDRVSRMLSNATNSLFAGDNYSEDHPGYNFITSAQVIGNAIKLDFSTPRGILNLVNCFRIVKNGSRYEMYPNSKFFLGVLGTVNFQDIVKFDKLIYTVHNSSFTDQLIQDKYDDIRPIASNVTSISLEFSKTVNGVESPLNPIFCLRVLSNHNYLIRLLFARLLIIQPQPLTSVSNVFHISDDYLLFLRDQLYITEALAGEFLAYKKIIPRLTNPAVQVTDFPASVLALYNSKAIDYIPLNWSERNTMDSYFTSSTNVKAFSFVNQGSSIFVNFFSYDLFTIDLIHVKKGKTVIDHVSEFGQDYSCILNGPFFITNVSAFLSGDKATMVGFRKFRITHDGVPQNLNSKLFGTDQKWFLRKMSSEPTDLPAKIKIGSDKNAVFERGLLSDEEVENAVCAFDSMAFCYSGELGANSPLNPASDSFPMLISEGNTGNANKPHNGLPFIGLARKSIDGVSRLFIVSIVLEEGHKIDQPWPVVYQLVEEIEPEFLLFTDGSDSVYLNFLGREVPVNFGKLYKNNMMPCLIGIIEKSNI